MLRINIDQYIQFDYFKPMFNDGTDPENAFLSNPEKVKLHIDENGLLKVKGKRYLRLGKINLFDPVQGEDISSRKFIGILDTSTGQVLCFDIKEIYEKYVQNGITQVRSPDQRTYGISSQTKEIVMNSVLDQKKDSGSLADTPIDFV